MDLPVNRLKRALREGRKQIGFWSQLASPIAAELLAGSGFDWIVLDTEHSPAELTTVHAQLQAMSGGAASAVVRPVWNDPVVFKRLLDIGVQSLLVPFVQNADEARRAVAATRYQPEGLRGFAGVIRANDYGRVKDYHVRAHEEVLLMVQLETRVALSNLESIAAVEGVDGLFIGPGDLAADLGHLADTGHPDVRAVIDRTLERIRATGKIAGILAPVETDARQWLEGGCQLVAVGSDVGLLARQSEKLAERFKNMK